MSSYQPAARNKTAMPIDAIAAPLRYEEPRAPLPVHYDARYDTSTGMHWQPPMPMAGADQVVTQQPIAHAGMRPTSLPLSQRTSMTILPGDSVPANEATQAADGNARREVMHAFGLPASDEENAARSVNQQLDLPHQRDAYDTESDYEKNSGCCGNGHSAGTAVDAICSICCICVCLVKMCECC